MKMTGDWIPSFDGMTLGEDDGGLHVLKWLSWAVLIIVGLNSNCNNDYYSLRIYDAAPFTCQPDGSATIYDLPRDMGLQLAIGLMLVIAFVKRMKMRMFGE